LTWLPARISIRYQSAIVRAAAAAAWIEADTAMAGQQAAA